MIDVRNHAIHQSSFDKEDRPFLALIIGPYSQKNRVESLLRIFHLNGGNKGDLGKPYNLTYKNLPQTKLKKSFLNNELKTLLTSYKDHKDLIDLKVRWSTAAGSQSSSNLILKEQAVSTPFIGRTREDKLIEALELMLQRNIMQSKKRGEII